MNSSASTSRYILTALAIILVFTAFILVGLNAMNISPSFNSPLSSTSQEELDAKYREGFLAARGIYQGQIPEMPSDDAKAFNATVLSNVGGTLTVSAVDLDTDLLVDGIGKERTIQITSNTKVRELEPKNPDALATEITAYEAQNNPTALAPSPDTERLISISEVKEGMRVRIHANEAIRLLPTIQATIITVLK